MKLNTMSSAILSCQKNDVCWNNYNSQNSNLNSCINSNNDLCTTDGKTFVNAQCVCNCIKSLNIINTLILLVNWLSLFSCSLFRSWCRLPAVKIVWFVGVMNTKANLFLLKFNYSNDMYSWAIQKFRQLFRMQRNQGMLNLQFGWDLH